MVQQHNIFIIIRNSISRLAIILVLKIIHLSHMVSAKKRNRSIIRIILYLIPSIFAVSCVETVVMDPLEEMPAVVNCVLTRKRDPGKNDVIPVQTLNLFYAKRPSDKEYLAISDAVVKVSGAGETYDFTWDGEQWTSTFLPEFDTEYSLEVSLPDGNRLSASIVVPKNMLLSGTSVYSSTYNFSSAKYYSIQPSGEAFIWITGVEDRPEISHFCTNHSGADDSNIINNIWQDLPIAKSVRDNFSKILDNNFELADKDFWMKFGRQCLDLPIHKDYLRIHHYASFDNGISEPLIQIYRYGDEGSVNLTMAEGFILAADLIDAMPPPPESIGMPVSYCLPVRTYFLSGEYDLYLSKIIGRGFHKDELAAMYSMDENYTNIEGGLGIFGAMYYSDYVY